MTLTDNAQALAEQFHEVYERLAPSFGYETRPDTRSFDPSSRNGKLMTAVCSEVLASLATTPPESPSLREAAQAVVDRWETPLWKDVPSTASFIYRLRDALATTTAGGGEPVAWRHTGHGLKRFLTQKQYDAQTPATKDWYEPFTCANCTTHPAPATEKQGEATARMVHDFPALSAFHSKHALGPMRAPSCLCCGRSTQGLEIGVKHMELPGVVICKICHTAALATPIGAGAQLQRGWQPIETAPTDGAVFLAFKPGIGHIVAVILDQDHPDCEYDGGVHESWSHKYVEGVTHWMPLPAPAHGEQTDADAHSSMKWFE